MSKIMSRSNVNQDDIIVTGHTSSSDFPTLNGYDESYNGGENDIFITKFNASGGLVWSTFFGGTNTDFASSIAVDSQNNIAITATSKAKKITIRPAIDLAPLSAM